MSKRTRLPVPLQRMPSFERYVSFLLGAGYCASTQKLLHDLITNVFLQSLQYGILVMGFIDAFVYAHLQHRSNIGNSGGRIRFMTAITPSCAHAYQATCLTRHMPAVPRRSFRLPKPKARYPHLTNGGNDFQRWAIFQTGVLALWMVKPQQDGVPLHDLSTEENIMFGLISLSQVPELTPTTPLTC